MTAHESLSDFSKPVFTQRRFIAIALVAVFILVAATFTSSVNAGAHKKTKIPASFAAALPVENSTPNPAYTYGSKCSLNVAIAVDRSGSIYGDRDVLKNTIKGFYLLLNKRAKKMPAGSEANVLLTAFATYAQLQNVIPAGMSYEDWNSSINIANDDNLAAQQSIVDDIWFQPTSSNSPYDPGRSETASKGYYGGKFADGTNQRPSDALMAATNYDAALTMSAVMMNVKYYFLDAASGKEEADKDFDMVLMITDGVPTVNLGDNHVPDFNEPSLLTTSASSDTRDIETAYKAVNTIRKGEAFIGPDEEPMADLNFRNRPPAPVIGILAGDAADDEIAKRQMRTIFGPQNSTWFAAKTFSGDLKTALENAVATVGCDVEDKEEVEAKFTVEASPESQTLGEGDTGYINLRITNTGEGPIDVTQINVYGPGSSDSDAFGKPPSTITLPIPLRIAPGETKAYPLPGIAGVAGPDIYFHYGVFASAIIDPMTQVCTGGEGDDPCVQWRESGAKVSTTSTAYPS